MKLLLTLLLGALPASLLAAVPLGFSWGSASGGGGFDQVRGLTGDGNGFAYAVGSFESNARFGTTNVSSTGQQDAFVVKFSPNGDVVWARQMGGTGIDRAQAVAVDGEGNVFVGGDFYGAASFGGTNLTPAVGADAFLARLSADGEVLWVRQISGGSDDFANALAIAPGGGVYLAGSFTGPASVAGTPLPGGGGPSMFLAHFDVAGQVVWAKQATGSQVITAKAMAVDANTNVLVAGQFSGAAIFSTQPPATLTSVAGGDAFLARYTSDGTLAWARSGGGNGDDHASGLAVSTNGGVYLCGGFQQSAQFGSTNVTAVAANDFYVAKYSPAGEVLWVRTGANGNGTTIVTSSSGALFAAGYFDGAAGAFSLGSFSLNGTNGITSSFLAELSDDGAPQNLIALHGGPSVFAVSTAGALEGSLLLGGYFAGQLRVAETTFAGPGNGGSLDGFVLRLAPPPFRIRVEPAVNGVLLAWPGAYSTATVEAASDLATNAAWDPVSGTILASGEERTLAVPADQPQRFFRLKP